MNPVKTCSTCNYFAVVISQLKSTEGNCHRYPPTRYEGNCKFPEVYAHDYCGEWKWRVERE